MIIALILSISVFLALNMGISGFSVSFAPSFGSRVLTRKQAALLYGLCVMAGASLLGPRVAETLANKISCASINPLSAGIILVSAAVTMFLSNALRVPQSTSFVTVASFAGAGMFYGKLNWGTLGAIAIFAGVFSAAAFAVTVAVKRKFYPPRHGNLRFYERFFIHRDKLKKFIIFHDMYSAFSVGTNNVANVAAPLMASTGMGGPLLFAAISPLFGLGAYLGGDRVINSVSKEIVPLGEFSASIVSFITATFVLFASLLGLPAPYVQFTTFSLLGISCVKDGFRHTSEKSIVKRILCVWILVPVAAAALSYFLHSIFRGYLN